MPIIPIVANPLSLPLPQHPAFCGVVFRVHGHPGQRVLDFIDVYPEGSCRFGTPGIWFSQGKTAQPVVEYNGKIELACRKRPDTDPDTEDHNLGKQALHFVQTGLQEAVGSCPVTTAPDFEALVRQANPWLDALHDDKPGACLRKIDGGWRIQSAPRFTGLEVAGRETKHLKILG